MEWKWKTTPQWKRIQNGEKIMDLVLDRAKYIFLLLLLKLKLFSNNNNIIVINLLYICLFLLLFYCFILV